MPAMLEDPDNPTIYRMSGRPPYPDPLDPNSSLPPTIQLRHVMLRDRQTKATVIPLAGHLQVPRSLLSYLCDQLNKEIEGGDTYPMTNPMTVDKFARFWLQNFGAVMLLSHVPDDAGGLREDTDWARNCLGSFYIRPNYPGRSSHVCNAGFLVTDKSRNRGVGRLMAEIYLEWAPRLGYTYSVFNLVYETNVASCKIWDALSFKRIGRVKGSGNLRSYPDRLVDAIIYGRDLSVEEADRLAARRDAATGPRSGAGGAGGTSELGNEVSDDRFDKIAYYLRYSEYPRGSNRAEKSRLRAASTHYKLVDDKLMLKGKEVISDPKEQVDIVIRVHDDLEHAGINKTTTATAERYHWGRIKETVSEVVRRCDVCRENGKTGNISSSGGGGSLGGGCSGNSSNGSGDCVGADGSISLSAVGLVAGPNHASASKAGPVDDGIMVGDVAIHHPIVLPEGYQSRRGHPNQSRQSEQPPPQRSPQDGQPPTPHMLSASSMLRGQTASPHRPPPPPACRPSPLAQSHKLSRSASRSPSLSLHGSPHLARATSPAYPSAPLNSIAPSRTMHSSSISHDVGGAHSRPLEANRHTNGMDVEDLSPHPSQDPAPAHRHSQPHGSVSSHAPPTLLSQIPQPPPDAPILLASAPTTTDISSLYQSLGSHIIQVPVSHHPFFRQGVDGGVSGENSDGVGVDGISHSHHHHHPQDTHSIGGIGHVGVGVGVSVDVNVNPVNTVDGLAGVDGVGNVPVSTHPHHPHHHHLDPYPPPGDTDAETFQALLNVATGTGSNNGGDEPMGEHNHHAHQHHTEHQTSRQAGQEEDVEAARVLAVERDLNMLIRHEDEMDTDEVEPQAHEQHEGGREAATATGEPTGEGKSSHDSNCGSPKDDHDMFDIRFGSAG